jgi:hypothetical protein
VFEISKVCKVSGESDNTAPRATMVMPNSSFQTLNIRAQP